MTALVFIDAACVAAMLDLCDGDAFLRRRVALEENHGFPPPVPWASRPLKWRADLVQAWIDRQGLPQPAGPGMALALEQGVSSGKVALMALARVR